MYLIEGVLDAQRVLSLQPARLAEGEQGNKLKIHFADGFELPSLRLEFECPAGIHRRNRLTSVLLVPNNGVIEYEIPAAVLAHPGKVYVQAVSVADGHKWCSLLNAASSFICTESICAQAQVSEQGAADLIDSMQQLLSEIKAAANEMQDSIPNDYINAATVNQQNGHLTLQKANGGSITLNTGLNGAVTDFVFQEATQALVLTLADGSTLTVPLEDLRTQVDATLVANSANAAASGAVKTEIDRLDSEKQDVGDYYCATNPPTRATVENQNQLNLFYGFSGSPYVNFNNGTAQANSTVVFCNGTSSATAYMDAKFGALYQHDQRVPAVPDAEQLSTPIVNGLPIGSYLIGKSSTIINRGRQVFVSIDSTGTGAWFYYTLTAPQSCLAGVWVIVSVAFSGSTDMYLSQRIA